MHLRIERASSWIRNRSFREIVPEVKNSLDFLTNSLRNKPGSLITLGQALTAQ
jgi:hypothetical protein